MTARRGQVLAAPRLRVPQPRPQERLAAVVEHLLDVDHQREQRAVPLDGHVVEEGRLAAPAGPGR